MIEKTDTFCVIGDPVAHSLSPTLHRHILDAAGLDGYYEAIRVSESELADFVAQCREYEHPGFNVTIPHKERILSLLDELDPLARRICAVNTVASRSGRFIGFNTDVTGFRSALKRNGSFFGGTVVLLGAGGAARAVVEALRSWPVERLVVTDPDINRSGKLEADFSSQTGWTWNLIHPDEISEQVAQADLIINATPVGLWPDIDASPLDCPEVIQPDTVVFDLVPNPVRTRLLREAESRSARTISGLDMLISQAIASQEIWQECHLSDDLFSEIWTKMTQEYSKS